MPTEADEASKLADWIQLGPYEAVLHDSKLPVVVRYCVMRVCVCVCVCVRERERERVCANLTASVRMGVHVCVRFKLLHDAAVFRSHAFVAGLS